MEASWWERLTEEETGSCSDGQGCGPFLLFDLRPNYGRGNEDNGNLLQMVLCTHSNSQGPQLCSMPLLPMPPLETPGHSWTRLDQSLLRSLLLSPVSWCAQDFVCVLQESVSPVLCKFWQLNCGVNGDLLQEDLCHTKVCCTQSPCPCGRPLLTLKHSKASLAQSLWGLLVCIRFCLSPLSMSGGYGIWF